MAELISISWGERKSKGLVVTKTGGHHKFENSSIHSMNAALAAVISELEQWVTQKAFLYFCLGLKTVPVSFLCLWLSPIPTDFDDSSRILVYLEKCEQPDTVLKTQTAQTATWMKKMMNFSFRSHDTHTALYRTNYKWQKRNIVAVWWNVKGILKE